MGFCQWDVSIAPATDAASRSLFRLQRFHKY